MDRGRLKLACAGVLAAAIAGCAILGFARPTALAGAAAWSVVVAAVLYGLGGAVRRGLGVELRIGEQLIAGTAVWIAASGVLLAAGVASRGPLLVLAGLGAAAALAELYARARAPRAEVAPADAEARGDRLALAVFWTLLSVFLALNLLGMIGTRGNPADDQAAYTALIKRVLDCGDLVEPFSFRRLSAYGGQTMLHALAALRGDVAAIDLLDRGIFQWIGVLVLLDLAHRRRIHFGIRVVLVVVLLSLWDLNLNSGPIWTGFTCFVAAYGFATRDDLPLRARLVLALGALGAACTLRQNYLVPAGLFGLFLVVGHLRDAARAASWRAAWTAERRTLLAAVAAAAVVVVPYMSAAYASSRTALYPIMLGTGNPAAPLRPIGATFLDEVSFFIQIVFTPEPIRVWWLLLPVMLVAKDTRPMRPWRAFLLASAIGFVVLVHSFMLSDSWNLWRYGFGYLTPLALVFAIEAATQLAPDPPARAFRLPLVAVFLVWLALIVNLVETRKATAKRFVASLQSVRAGAVHGTAKYEPRLRSYAPLQRSIPAGATIAILLDDPWMLDYARNPIVNLDLPGFAAPAPGLPSFTTPAHWRAYFASQGIRYLAFTDFGESTYLYRRASWMPRMYRDGELYQFIGAHMVDAFDAIMALTATSTVLFHADGMYAIDLGPDAPPEPDRGPPELARMDAFLRRISETEYRNNAWQLANRSTVVFKPDGVGPGPLQLPGLEHVVMASFWEMMSGLSDPPHRWLMDRTHVRVFGTGRERIHVRLWVRDVRAVTIPIVTLSLDGETIAQARPDAAGHVILDAAAPCHGWCDLYILFNSTFDWWMGPEDNSVAQLFELDWAAP